MGAIEQLFLWFDGAPVRYWVLAWTALAGTALLAGFPHRGRAGTFAALVLLTLVVFRWPAWFYPEELNPDEAQTLAGAITLARHPVYWKYVDGATHGPVCEILPVLAHWAGAPLSYVAVRILTTVLQALVVLSIWGMLRALVSERSARLGALTPLAFWSFTLWDDFVHYSSELPGLALLGAGGWLLAIVLRSPARRGGNWLAAAGGCLLGAVPFSKLQLVPMGLLLGGLALAALWRRAGPGSSGRRLAGWCLGGALVPTLGTAVFLSVFGLWHHFHASYILGAIAYTGSRDFTLLQGPVRFLNFSATDPGFAWFFWGGVSFVLLHARFAAPTAALRFARYAAGALLVVAFYCVFRPGREVVHYLQLLVLPLGLLIGLSSEIGSATPAPAAPPRASWPALAWLAALTLLPQIHHRAITWNRFIGHLPTHLAHQPSAAARYLRDHAAPEDTVAVWGWKPHLLVEAQLPHGTRDAGTAYQVFEWPLRHYYRIRYLWDMERRQPAWFVDTVGPAGHVLTDRATAGHEHFAELDALIKSNYMMVAELSHFRIYRRTAR